MHDDILIAEHDVVSRTRLTAILQGMGYTTRTFENGCDAWESFQEKPSQIVICDRVVPGLDGVSFCQLLRNHPTTSYTVFILVTASFTTADAYQAAAAADVDDFLVKPLRRDAVWRRLHVARRILKAARHIQNVEQLLPICTRCKRIREDAFQNPAPKWQPMDEYVQKQPGPARRFAVCPECRDQERS